MSGNVHVFDARELRCPMPVLKTNALLKTLAPGDYVRILTRDPSAPDDLAGYCRQTGHVLISQKDVTEGFETVIRKSEAQA